MSSRGNDAHPTIRHAGRAHIRGRIRRIWRPRYLELCDDGLVRYFELPPSADITRSEDSDWDHVHMIPKDTIMIYHARIIDVTTLRDLHVGLPRGSFGFLFRGKSYHQVHQQHYHHNQQQHQQQQQQQQQQLLHQYPPKSSSNSNSNTTATTNTNTHPYHNQQHHHRHQNILASPTNSNISLSESTSLACHPHMEPNPPRDYLCAVSTLEEAQTWVVALHWAATVALTAHSTWDSATINEDMMAELAPSLHPIPRSLTQQQQQQQPPQKSSSLAHRSDSDPTTEISKTKKTESSNKKPKMGKIVVTKVTKYHLVRIQNLQWELAYEIHVLLLQQRKHKKKRNATSAVQQQVSGGSGKEEYIVEERRILRTPQDLQNLLEQLEVELNRQDQSQHQQKHKSLLEKMRSKVLTLPRISSSSSLANRNKKRVTQQDVRNSYPIVDGILRALAMEASIVNCQAMKNCIVLGEENNSTIPEYDCPQSTTIWNYFLHCHMSQSIIYRKMRTIPENVATDDFVKHWLFDDRTTIKNNKSENNNKDGAAMYIEPLSEQQQHAKTSGNESLERILLWIVQRPSWTLSPVVGVILAVLCPILKVYYRFVPSVTIRIDLLVLSWLMALFLGYRYGQSKHLRSSGGKPKVHGTSAKRRKVSADIASNTAIDSNMGLSSTATSPTTDIAPLESDEDEDDGEELDYDDTADANVSGISNGASVKNGLSSPLPVYPANGGESCWSIPQDGIFRVRGITYLHDRIKIPSSPSPFKCRGVDVWLTDNPERHIARHPSVLGGALRDEDTFLVNFLLPFGNFVSYFRIPPISEFPPKLASVWTKFLKGDQQYRDARLKLLPVVMDGPWIVKAAVGNGTAPALLGKVIPLQYFFKDPDETTNGRGIYEVDVIITASSIAKGILSVVKGHTKSLTIAFAFIIEAAEQEELPETVLCAFQVHALHLEDCPHLPECNLEEQEIVEQQQMVLQQQKQKKQQQQHQEQSKHDMQNKDTQPQANVQSDFVSTSGHK